LEVYRLLREQYAGTNPFDGEGSFRFGARWSSVGTRVCYAAAHRSLAILEYRAHIDPAFMPNDLVIATLLVPDDISIAAPPTLPKNWRRFPPPDSLRAVGDEFIAGKKSALMLLPSVLVPEENNVLINPRHPDARRMLLKPELVPFSYDARLL